MIVDNGSTDATVEVAESFRDRLPSLQVITTSTPGRHHACNAGVAVARGDALVFVDADDEVAAGFLQAMADALATQPVVAGRLEHRRLNANADGGFGEVQTIGLMDGFGFLPYASGGCFGVQRSVLAASGGFGSDKHYCEDVDLSWRIQLRGYSIAFAPAAAVSVRQRGSARDMYRQHRNFGEGRALLYRDYRQHGMPRRSVLAVLGDWLRLVRALPWLRTDDQRARFIRRFGRAVGFVRGSFKYRVFYP